jgi:hypothetical protein
LTNGENQTTGYKGKKQKENCNNMEPRTIRESTLAAFFYTDSKFCFAGFPLTLFLEKHNRIMITE